jgi:hypothetical protein
MKEYKLSPGSCNNCTLGFNCESNKDKIIHFLTSLGLDRCKEGYCYIVVE